MIETLQPNSALNAIELAITLDSLAADQIDSGSPRTGDHELLRFGSAEIGVWEHTPGVSTDVEADEAFVVVCGNATVEFIDSGEVLQLAPGVVARLAAGTRTRWTVTTTLRKVYIT